MTGLQTKPVELLMSVRVLLDLPVDNLFHYSGLSFHRL